MNDSKHALIDLFLLARGVYVESGSNLGYSNTNSCPSEGPNGNKDLVRQVGCSFDPSPTSKPIRAPFSSY
jgi:hypothetical protein